MVSERSVTASKEDKDDISVVRKLQLDFSWTANTGTFVGDETDEAAFIVYNPAKHDFVMQLGGVIRMTWTMNWYYLQIMPGIWYMPGWPL